MGDATCSSCGLTTSIRSLFDLNGQTYCGKCVLLAAQSAKNAGQSSAYIPLINRSICGRCNSYISDSSTVMQSGSVRFCGTCAPLIKDWGYPSWLKISLAAVILLLVVALAHGKRYFHAGREMYVGEHLIEQGKYAEALPHLKETLAIAPGSDKASLLAAKAALMIGDVQSADKALHDHNDGHYEDGQDAQFLEVNSLWDRANQAIEKANQAAKLAQEDGKSDQAAKLMHEAATLYPQVPSFALSAESLDGGVAFERGDYDSFLAISEHQWKESPVSDTAAQLSSAFACKFAVTGTTDFRQKAEEMLDKARQLAQGDLDTMKSLDEYAPRIQYRLNSRKIISKKEYDRLFRGNKSSAK